MADEGFELTSGVKEVWPRIRSFSAVDEEYRKCLETGALHVFGKALRIFGLTTDPNARNILEWNDLKGWKSSYKGFIQEVWSFAEDVFGYQFLFDHNGVIQLDIETGKVKKLCDNFTEWIGLIMGDPNFYSGSSVAHEWDIKHPNEKLTGKYHLCPVTLFVCGGKYQIDNLFRLDGEKHLRVMGTIAHKIKDLPDGTPIEISFTD